MKTIEFGNSLPVQLQNNATKFRSLFDSAADGILILEDNVVVDCNQRIPEMFDLLRDEIIGQSLTDWSPLEQEDGTLSTENFFEKLSAARLGQAQSFEWIHFRKGGSRFYVEVNLYRIGIDSDRQLIAILREINDRKHLHFEVQSNSEQLKAAHLELISLYQELAVSGEAIEQQLTELKESEKKLQFTEQRYQLAMDASNDAIWEVDISTDELSF